MDMSGTGMSLNPKEQSIHVMWILMFSFTIDPKNIYVCSVTDVSFDVLERKTAFRLIKKSYAVDCKYI